LATLDDHAASGNLGVAQNGRFLGCTENGQSRASQGTPRFGCNPDLNYALGSQ